MIPGQNKPTDTFQKAARHVRPGGALVVTTADPISTLPELLRRLWRISLVSSDESFEVQASIGAEVFGRHLANLPGVLRPSKDWVIDNVLHPWPKTWAFGVDTAILQAKEEFHFLGSSPRFLLDYRWYKSIVGAAFDFNQIALTQWETFKFSTLDCRVSIPPQVGVSEIHAGSLLASRVNDLVYDMWSSNSYDEWARLAEVLTEIKLMIATIDGLEGTAQSLDDFIGKFPKVMDGDVLADLASFESWWGRGQQYLSFIRKKDYRPDWTKCLVN
jgi:hypothetical protein